MVIVGVVPGLLSQIRVAEDTQIGQFSGGQLGRGEKETYHCQILAGIPGAGVDPASRQLDHIESAKPWINNASEQLNQEDNSQIRPSKLYSSRPSLNIPPLQISSISGSETVGQGYGTSVGWFSTSGDGETF